MVLTLPPIHAEEARATSPPPSSSQSPFPFLRLPPEIRLQVYIHLFGPSPVHLMLEEEWLAHVRCPDPTHPISCGQRLISVLKMHKWGMTRNQKGDHSWDAFVRGVGHLSRIDVAILTTCRLVYAEAVAVLYSLSFYVQNVKTWQCFASRLGPLSLAAMNDIRMGWQWKRFSDAFLVDPDFEPGEEWWCKRGADMDRLGYRWPPFLRETFRKFRILR